MTIPLQQVPPFPTQTPFLANTTKDGAGNTNSSGSKSGISKPAEDWLIGVASANEAALANISAQAVDPVTLANLPVLTSEDSGFIVYVTDFNHTLQWDGTAWQWGPGDSGSGYFGFFLQAPTAGGWHLCDGSSVEMLNADGTTTLVALPNYSSNPYLKVGTSASAGPNAPSGESESVSAGTPEGTNAAKVSGTESADATVQSGSGASVAAAGHTHTVAGQTFTGSAMAVHQHGPGTIDLQNTVLMAFFRQ